MHRIILAFLLVFLTHTQTEAQDTLPRFSLIERGPKRVLISWTNPFPYTAQISIQRSADSTKNFKTILTVPDANVPQNGFVDTKSPGSGMFYRLFIVLDSGKYQFSRSKRPSPDTASSQESVLQNDNQRVKLSDSLDTREMSALKKKLDPVATAPRPEKFFTLKRRDSIIGQVSEKGMKKFRDSLLLSSKDTLVFASVDTILIKPFIPKEVYRASRFVYTEKFGNVMLALPEAATRKYSVSFFEEDKTPLFELKEVQSPSLILDKSNFLHAGWFWFELYEDGKLKERHKFFIPKDF